MSIHEREPAGEHPHHHDHDHNREHATVLSAAEAYERIHRGELIQGVRIVGLRLNGSFSASLRMKHVVLVRPVFERVEFQSEVVFDHCTLEYPLFSTNACFGDGLDFRGSRLIRPIFRGLIVRGFFQCDQIETRGKLLIQASTFEGRVRCWEAKFGGWVEFKECTFKDVADFRSFHADEGFVLQDCAFESDALFRGSTCSKKWEAIGTTFHGLLDLSKAKLHDFVYLESIHQGDRQRFAFHNALAERLLIRTDQLVGRLESEERGEYAQAMHEYGLLKRAFEGLHRYEQEDWAFYRFKVNQRRSRQRSWNRPWSKITQFFDWLMLDLGCGYGADPLRAVRSALIIMLFFGLIYMIGVESLYVEKLPFQGRGASYLPNRILVGMLTSVSVFTSGFGSLRDTAKGWMNLPLILESLLGTFLWGLFIVAYSRKVIR